MRHDQREPRNLRRDEQRPSRREASERRDWYERDEMDERSGYRDEDYRPSSEYRDASDYRRDFNYSNQDYGRTQGSRELSRGSRSIDGNRSGSSYESSASGRQDRYGSSGEQSYGRSYDDRNERSWDRSERSERGSGYEAGRFDSRRGLYGTSDLTRQGSDQYRTSSSFDTDRDRSSERGSERSSERSEGRSQFFGRGPKSYKRSDERIKEDVCEMLTRDNNIDAEGIEVEVKDGEVTLSGTVPDRRMKHMAEDCAEGCYGVKDVTNNIRVNRESSSEKDTSSTSSLSSERSSSTTGTTGTSGTKKSSSSSTSTNAPNH
ncbi:BON domain-containing protein [Bdellovibrio bacteriovorus]|uniref:BON domain-containing protein n=1 Tax=Bdellovibrio bacteriovorus TaxID=959 RepID=A0A1Z3N7S4_BDEBC|nr:BON domain-containing protein [Bdellovibrio bacteriovorus]ASD63505.1 BON domain-containing protein [Bdellovibrio bacteriovorus]